MTFKLSYVFSFLFYLLCLPQLALAQKKVSKAFQITQCLGAEEKLIHEAKNKGAAYQINQLLLSIFINLPNINLKKNYYQQLCQNVEIGTSLVFLDLIFRNYNLLFTYAKSENEKFVKLEDIAELINKLPELFNQYLLEIKTNSPTHDCLENHIKELADFYIQIRYLEEDSNFKVIADKNKQLIKILDQLKNKDLFFEECSKNKEKPKT